MRPILSIETATTVCSVAISSGRDVLAERKLYTERSHANELTLLIQELTKESNITMKDFKAVAVSEGPGSYTGLRIGTSTAKGLCFALGIPLIGVSTLKAMALEVNINHSPESILCPMIDARRMEVYVALYDQHLNVITEPHPSILDENSFEETLKQKEVLFFGNGSDKFKSIKKSNNALFLDSISPSAWSIGFLAEEKFLNNEFADLAYFEPSYLKEFQATTPKPIL